MAITKTPQSYSAFTLIEVLVALVIIAIALVAVIKVSAENIENHVTVQNKSVATLLASNVLSEAQLGLINAQKNHPTTLLNTAFLWSLIEKKTATARVLKLTVTVKSAANGANILSMWGFKYV